MRTSATFAKRLFATILSTSVIFASLVVVASPGQAAAGYQVVVHVPTVAGFLPANAKVTLVDAANSANLSDSRLTGQDAYGWFGVVEMPAGAAQVKVRATASKISSASVAPASTREIWLNTAGAPFARESAATLKLRVGFIGAGSQLAGRSLKVTVGSSVKIYGFSVLGARRWANVPVTATTTAVKVTLRKNSRDGKTYLINPQKYARVWISDNFSGARTSEAWANDRAVIHYHRADANYAQWGLHVWSNTSTGGANSAVTWVAPLSPISINPDAWGVTFSVALKPNSQSLPFIIHNGNVKDPSNSDQLLNLAASKGEVWFESGLANTNGSIHLTIPVSFEAIPVPPAPPVAATPPSISEASTLASSPVRSAFAQDNIYFVMTDRYQNGNATNDRMGLSGSRDVTAYDPTSTAYYHGGDLAGLTDGCSTGNGIARIKGMGFTSIWLTPPFKQRYVQSGSAAYHGYWITDFTDIDPHLGTKADFAAFIDCAHSQGMKVVMDIVMNHTGDVNYYPSGNYSFGATRPAAIAPQDANLRKPAFLNDLANYHNRGNVQDWSVKDQYQNGDFFGLDDVYTEKAAVVEGFAQVYADWVNNYGVDGFRIDTAKHVDDAFFSKWWPRVLELTASKKPNLFAYGEVYDSNTSTLTQFVRDRSLPAVLDFAFQNAAVQFAAGNDIGAITNVFNADDWYTTATSNAHNQVTFLGNHDMGRFGQMLKYAGDPDGDLWGDALLGYDLMYMSRGIPNVYYGDELGIIGNGGDQGARQDLFATSVSDWKTQSRIAASPIGNASYLDVRNHPIQERITALNQLRTSYPALADGAQIMRYSSNNVIAFSRIDQSDRREFLVALNNAQSTRSNLRIQTSSPLTTFTTVWGQSQTVTSDANGFVNVWVADRQAIVLRAQSQLPTADTIGAITLTLPQDSGVALWKPTASISNWLDPSICTFVYKINSGPWQVLGVDDSADFKMILDGSKFGAGTKLTVAAIIRSSSGAIGVSNAVQVSN